jgi:hypothetical protein
MNVCAHLCYFALRVLCCCRYFLEAIDSIPIVRHPQALLRKLLQRPWLDSAYGPALLRLHQAWRSPAGQVFDIATTSRAILQAPPAVGLFRADPTLLLPAIQCACQPMACPADQVAPLVEAASLLLEAYPATWQPSHLSAAIHATSAAKPPPNCTSEARQAFHLTQTQLLKLLLDHCCAPPATGDPNLFLHPHIKTAMLAGAEAAVLELLLSRAPLWQPDGLRDTDEQGRLVGYSWVEQISRYTKLYPVIVKAAAARGIVYQLMPPLLQLVQHSQHNSLSQQRMPYLVQALAAPECSVTAGDLLPVVLMAAATCNVTLLQALSTYRQFRWPAAQLAPLLTQLAGGFEDRQGVTVQLLLQLVEGEGFSMYQLAPAVQTAARTRHIAPGLMTSVTQPMCHLLVSACRTGWHDLAIAAMKMNLLHGALLLKDLYHTSSNGSAVSGVSAAADPSSAGAASANAAAQHTSVLLGQLLQQLQQHTGPAPGQQLQQHTGPAPGQQLQQHTGPAPGQPMQQHAAANAGDRRGGVGSAATATLGAPAAAPTDTSFVIQHRSITTAGPAVQQGQAAGSEASEAAAGSMECTPSEELAAATLASFHDGGVPLLPNNTTNNGSSRMRRPVAQSRSQLKECTAAKGSCSLGPAAAAAVAAAGESGPHPAAAVPAGSCSAARTSIEPMSAQQEDARLGIPQLFLSAGEAFPVPTDSSSQGPKNLAAAMRHLKKTGAVSWSADRWDPAGKLSIDYDLCSVQQPGIASDAAAAAAAPPVAVQDRPVFDVEQLTSCDWLVRTCRLIAA